MHELTSAHARTTVRRTENDELRLQAAWPARVQLRAREPDKMYSALPHLFAGAFSPLAGEVLQRFALACKLLHGTELLHAAEPAAERFAPIALRAAAAQLEANAILADLFGGERRVWDALLGAQRRLAYALVEEDAYRSGRRDISELTDADALELARADEGSLRVAIAGLGALARNDAPCGALLRSVDRYAEARRLAGDLRGWKADLAARRPTLVLARLARAGGGDARVLAERLYARGIARDVLALAELACGEALHALAGVDGIPVWRGAVQLLARRLAAYRETLASAMTVPA
jgi:hypothetical protein